MTKNTRRTKSAAIKAETPKIQAPRFQTPVSQPQKTALPRAEAPKAESPKLEPAKVTAVAPAPPAPTAPRRNQVSLQFVKPGAKSVYVAGSFNEWKPEKTPLVPAGNGRWVGDLAIRPGRHEYLFVVDGEWLPDPNAKETVENPFGGKNSVLVASE